MAASVRSRKFVCNKEVTIETEKELTLLAKVREFSKPSACLILGHAFASHREGRHYTQHALSKGVLLVFGIEHRNHLTLTDRETSLAKLPPEWTKCSFQADKTRSMRTLSFV